MVSQQPRTVVEPVIELLEASAQIAQLEGEIAQLKDALAKRQQIGVATGLLAQRFGITPERAWSLLVRLSQNGHVKVRDIAQAMINAHSGRLSAAEAELKHNSAATEVATATHSRDIVAAMRTTRRKVVDTVAAFETPSHLTYTNVTAATAIRLAARCAASRAGWLITGDDTPSVRPS